MIELRWCERRIETQWSFNTERVLQYRQRIYAISTTSGFGNYGPWSDWQDVPTVREE